MSSATIVPSNDSINNKLSSLSQQNELNRIYDELTPPTTIDGGQINNENGFINTNYAGTGGYYINNKNKKQIFQIIDYQTNNKKKYRNFKGSWPAQAAHKALSLLSKNIYLNNSNNMNQIKFWIINILTKKKYCYIGTRIKLVKPTIITLKNGNIIKYWYKTILKRCDDI